MPLLCNVGTLTSWNPLGLSGPAMGLLYLFYWHVIIPCCLHITHNQRATHILWNPNILYRFYKSRHCSNPEPQNIRSNPPFYSSSKLRFNIILPSAPRTCQVASFILIFPIKYPACLCVFFYACHTYRPSYPPWFDDENIFWHGLQVVKSSLRSFLQSPVTSSWTKIASSSYFSRKTFPLCQSPHFTHTHTHTHTVKQ